MLTLSLALLAAARIVQAQSFGTQINNYGTVAFIRTGERTPWIRGGSEMLSALGAQQMLELGQNFRGRYIDEDTGATRLGVRPIEGMAQDRLNPDQLFIQTLDKPFLVAAAQAFMQGLYPPYSLNETRNGPRPDAVGILANNSVVDYPLDGYQYANIQTVGMNDPQRIGIDGHDQCLSAILESADYEGTDQFLSTQAAESAFYQSLSMSWFKEDLPQEMLDYSNAYGIYDSLSYHNTHDRNTFRDLSNGNNTGVFDKVRYLAYQDAWYRYGNVSSDTDSSSSDRAVAGKTLASLILSRFEKIVSNNGNTTNWMSEPLNLIFGEYATMLSFLAVAEVDYQAHMEQWHVIPDFATALIFELFTRDNDTADDPDNLWVQFSFHNGTEDYQDKAPQAYTMFRNGHSATAMPWRQFSDSMNRIGISSAGEWCTACSPQSAAFCSAADANTLDGTSSQSSPSTGSRSKISPVVAGVIGALVTLAVAALLFGLAVLLGAIRFHRVEPRRKSSLGGFKGSAKLASDPDVGLAQKGVVPAGVVGAGTGVGGDNNNKRVVHERVGSWELRAKEGGNGTGDLGDESPRGSFEAIEAAMGRSVGGVRPVERV